MRKEKEGIIITLKKIVLVVRNHQFTFMESQWTLAKPTLARREVEEQDLKTMALLDLALIRNQQLLISGSSFFPCFSLHLPTYRKKSERNVFYIWQEQTLYVQSPSAQILVSVPNSGWNHCVSTPLSQVFPWKVISNPTDVRGSRKGHFLCGHPISLNVKWVGDNQIT